MTRIVLQEMALFLVPFALWALLLALQRKRILELEHWSRAATSLAVAGLVLMIVGLFALGIFSERQTGAYVPPHMENGKPVQGGFR